MKYRLPDFKGKDRQKGQGMRSTKVSFGDALAAAAVGFSMSATSKDDVIKGLWVMACCLDRGFVEEQEGEIGGLLAEMVDEAWGVCHEKEGEVSEQENPVEVIKDMIIYWVRSVGMGGKDLVPMYYKGRWAKDGPNGRKGDVKARPVSLGPGEFTGTYSPDDFRDEDGRPVLFQD